MKLKILIILLLFSPLLFYNKVNIGQIGISKNLLTGEIARQNPGIYFSPPWVLVSRISTKPIRVEVPTRGRGFSAKLVEFQPDHYAKFVDTEGWRYYWLDNRLSFNYGHEEEYRGFRNLMLGYAYSNKNYEFVKIVKNL